METGDKTDQLSPSFDSNCASGSDIKIKNNAQPKKNGLWTLDTEDLPISNGPMQELHDSAVEQPPLNEELATLTLQQNDDLQESFSRFRSRSEGSGLGLPKRGLLKKNSDGPTKLHRRVSFADSNGFELEQVRSFDAQPSNDLDAEEQPEECLLPACPSASSTSRTRPAGERRFVPYFTLPWNLPGKRSMVFAALEDRKVCLETFTINSSWRISGTILVKNLSFHKRVFVRRTLNKWQTYKDIEATYVCAVNENVDRFRFELHFAFKLPPGTRLEVALGYELGDGRGQYWDNNVENNYAFWFNDKL